MPNFRFRYFYREIVHLRIIPSYRVKIVFEKICAIQFHPLYSFVNVTFKKSLLKYIKYMNM
jgi:hypothetical protein